MKVEQVMTRNVEMCTPHDSLATAARIMWEHDCGVVPVVTPDGNAAGPVAGVITDRDVCMAAYTQGRPLHEIAVATAMSKNVCSCRPTDTIGVALKVMRSNQLRRLPVVDADDRLVGVLSLADLAREAVHEHGRKSRDVKDDAIGEALEAICTPRSSARDLVSAA